MSNEELADSFTRTGMKFCKNKSSPYQNQENNRNRQYCTETVQTIKLSDSIIKNKQYRTDKNFNLLPNKMITSTLCSVYTNGHFTKSPLKSGASRKGRNHKKNLSSLSNQSNNRRRIEQNDEEIQTERGDGLIVLDRGNKVKDTNDNIKQSSEIYIEDNNISNNVNDNRELNNINTINNSNVIEDGRVKSIVQIQNKENEAKNKEADQRPLEQSIEDGNNDDPTTKTSKKTKLKTKKKPKTSNQQNDAKEIEDKSSYSNKDDLITQRVHEYFYHTEVKKSPIKNQVGNPQYYSQNTTFRASSDDPFLSTSTTLLKDYGGNKYNDTQYCNKDGIDYNSSKQIMNTEENSPSRPCAYCKRSYCHNNPKFLFFNQGAKAKNAFIQPSYTKFDRSNLRGSNSNNNFYDEHFDGIQSEGKIYSKCKAKYSSSFKPTQYQFSANNINNPTKIFQNKDLIYSNVIDKYNNKDNDNNDYYCHTTINENKDGSHSYVKIKIEPTKKERDRDRNTSLEMKTLNILFKSKQLSTLIPDQSTNQKYYPSNTNSSQDLSQPHIKAYYSQYNKTEGKQSKRSPSMINMSKDSIGFEPEKGYDVLNNPNHKRASSYKFNYDYSIYDKQLKSIDDNTTSKPLQSTDMYLKQGVRGRALNNNDRSISHNKNDHYCTNYTDKQKRSKRIIKDDDNNNSRLTYELNSEDMTDFNNHHLDQINKQINVNQNNDNNDIIYEHCLKKVNPNDVKMNITKIKPSTKYSNNNKEPTVK